MSLQSFDSLPDDARLWCFGADRPLEGGAAERLLHEMRAFLGEWTAHRRDLAAGLALRHDRFLLVAVDESGTEASGCSIDALLHRLAGLERELGVRLTDGAPVWYRDSGGVIRVTDRSGFRRLAAGGEVDEDTVVFDLALTRVGDLRRGAFERPAREAWHARLLRTAERPGDAVRARG